MRWRVLIWSNIVAIHGRRSYPHLLKPALARRAHSDEDCRARSKKKINADGILEEIYLLPDLATTPQAPQTAQQGAVAVQPAVQATPTPQPVQPSRVATPQMAQGRPIQQVQQQPAQHPVAQAQPMTPQQPQQPRGMASGRSLDRIINSLSEQMNLTKQVVTDDGMPYIDPESESKLLQNQEAVVEAVLKAHPRFNVAFQNVQISGNTVTVEAPTQGVMADLSESESELCDIMARTAGVDGLIKLSVVLNEVTVKLMPVKIEDKFKYIEEIDPQGVRLLMDKFNLTI